MDSDPSTHELLAHFDRPRTIDCPDFEWSEERDATPERFVDEVPVEPVVVAAPPRLKIVAVDREFESRVRSESSPATREAAPHTRGVLWVLQWAAALGAIAAAVMFLAGFGYSTAADRAIESAARAAATEATLPRASYESIERVALRRLARYPQLDDELQVTVTVDGLPVVGWLHASGGDRVTVTVSAPRSRLLPGWMTKLAVWPPDGDVIATAQRYMPGRKLRVAKN